MGSHNKKFSALSVKQWVIIPRTYDCGQSTVCKTMGSHNKKFSALSVKQWVTIPRTYDCGQSTVCKTMGSHSAKSTVCKQWVVTMHKALSVKQLVVITRSLVQFE
jgi:hypothetical protein